jgi:hypothetical protein
MVPVPDYDDYDDEGGGDECGAMGGMLGKGNRSTRRKPAPVHYKFHIT